MIQHGSHPGIDLRTPTSRMSAVAQSRYIGLAKSLHPRLLRFLAKYPPSQILPKTTRTNNDAVISGETPNPFLPHKHVATGKWQEPEYSLRRQAELVKLAREEGVEELLPFTNKGTEERIRKRVEEGLRVKGTGVGQKVKGHLHERMLATKYVSLVLSHALTAGRGLSYYDTEHDANNTTGWRRDVQLSWVCPNWSSYGGKYVEITHPRIMNMEC